MIEAVYVSGPLTSGPPGAYYRNTKTAVEAGAELRRQGFLPFVPHAHSMSEFIVPVTYEEAMAFDFGWIKRCDAVLRLPGESAGGDREVAYAKSLGIPTFDSIPSLIEYARGQ